MDKKSDTNSISFTAIKYFVSSFLLDIYNLCINNIYLKKTNQLTCHFL